ncbi:MAG: ABC transporter ATP-binding protein [Phycisphaerales bacterium]
MPAAAATEPEPATTDSSAAVGAGSAADAVIEVRGLGKRFKIYARPQDRLAEWFTGGRVKRHTDFWAVRGVSLSVRRGECLGVVGANGSGKSTLLKMITGALHATEGAAEVRGRTLTLLDLGTGLNPQLTGRANIVNAARMLGFPPGYARETMPAIEAFADLGEFFDRAVGLYSTGMRVRLSFSMFACFRPDVFIVDEALSVGDVFFQQKCATRLREMLDAGLTMLFVSHDQGAILNLCDRAILMDHGRAVFEGEPAETMARYTASLRGTTKFGPKRAGAPPSPSACGTGVSPVRTASASPAKSSLASDSAAILEHDVIGDRAASRFGAGDTRVLGCRVTDADGRDALRAFMGEALTFHVLIEGVRPVEQPRVAVQLVNRFGTLLFACGTRMLGHRLPALAAGDRLIVRLELVMDLEPGQYSFSVSTSEPAEDDPNAGVTHDTVPDLGPLLVMLDKSKPRPFFGAARLNVRASHEGMAR